MRRPRTGSYAQVLFRGEPIDAFVPDALPPLPPIDFEQLLQPLIDAGAALARLDEAASLLSGHDQILYSFIRREAALSSQIEGSQSSFEDLLRYELDQAQGAPIDDVREVSNYVRALEYGIERLDQGAEIDERLLCELHRQILASSRGADKEPGQIRSRMNWIGGPHPAIAAFVPPPPDQVQPALASLLDFINAPDPETPVLARIGMAHLQFETIHPFLDGNGRVGRLLIALSLHQSRLLHAPIFHPSLAFKQRRADYYYFLDYVRQEGDWEAWLTFFIHGLHDAADEALDMVRRISALFGADRDRIVAEIARPASALAVHAMLSHRPLGTILSIADQANIAPPTAATALRQLAQLGIAAEITGRRRDRIFAYAEYLDILSEGAEPL